MNPIGAVAAISTFLAVWFGHVAVRKIEFAASNLQLPAAAFFTLGLLLEWLALTTPTLAASTAFGIIGITFLWDTLELWRQQGRVSKGHAPANPRNPRHAGMLNEPGTHATTVDLVKRKATAVLRQKGTRTSAEERGILY